MATISYRTKESSITYSSTKTDGVNKGMDAPTDSDKCRICRQAKGNSNALVIRMYKTNCNRISERQNNVLIIHWGYKKDCWEKTQNVKRIRISRR